ILVPLDGSFRAEQALPVAARLARATGGSLLLVRVVNPPIDYSGGLAPVPLMTDQILESEMAGATDYLTAVAARPALSGIEIMTEVLYGFPGQQLIESIEAHGTDLVVLCSHGRTGLSRWALGSVAHTLVHQSAAPVLILRQEGTPARVEAARSIRTLVPLDGSPLAEAALAPAAALTAALAAPHRGALRLVQVVKAFQSKAEEGLVSELNEEARRLAHSYLATAAQRMESTVAGRALAVSFSVELASDVASTLLGAAEQEGPDRCDVIAISTHGRGGLERWVMGSVTQRLLDTTRLPMLIVRPQREE
ncbi:MAG TPA: universal stress protein, partial [Ktedonobacterales bacterium]|nr:universal stress protein [Ktedonobacterales bacterium]